MILSQFQQADMRTQVHPPSKHNKCYHIIILTSHLPSSILDYVLTVVAKTLEKHWELPKPTSQQIRHTY